MTATKDSTELALLLKASEIVYQNHMVRCITCAIHDFAPPAPEPCPENGDDLRHRRDELRQMVDEAENGGPLL